ncbi:MAG: metallophosphoesterase [Kiritimatiellae bacterium]|nr:metallophosphoesterase [Kiritimatiellia bacterium]
MLTRRLFIAGLAASFTTEPRKLFAKEEADFDDNLLVFLSDVHAGAAKTCKYARKKLQEAVTEILKMRPLPRRVLVFGDVAHVYGLGVDYDVSRPSFKLLEDAGITVTVGMGNHDRRSEFAIRWPEAQKKSLVPGRFVHLVETSHVGFLMLDSLQGTDDRAQNDFGPVPGALSDDQQVFLSDFLSKRTKPVILCAHHAPKELSLCGKPLPHVVVTTPCIAGYIHGHNHRWMRAWIRDKDQKTPERAKHVLCLPSNGLWGDIGYATCRVSPGKVEVAPALKDFWLSRPVSAECRPPEWDDILAEGRASGPCTFRF